MTTTEFSSDEPVSAATTEDLKRDLVKPEALEAARLEIAVSPTDLDVLLESNDTSLHSKFQSVLRALQHVHRFGLLSLWMLMYSDGPARAVFERYPLVQVETWAHFDDNLGQRVMATYLFAPDWHSRFMRVSVEISYVTSVAGERHVSYSVETIEEGNERAG